MGKGQIGTPSMMCRVVIWAWYQASEDRIAAFLVTLRRHPGVVKKICKDIPIIEDVKGKKLVEPTKIRLDS